MLHDFVQVSPVQEELRQRAICRQALHAQQPPPHRAINRRDLEEQLSRPERPVDQLLRLGGEIFGGKGPAHHNRLAGARGGATVADAGRLRISPRGVVLHAAHCATTNGTRETGATRQQLNH